MNGIKEKKHRKLWRIAIPAILIAATAGAVLGVVLTKDRPDGAEEQLEASLEEWTAQWKKGDDSALAEGLVFGRPEEKNQAKEGDEIALDTEEIRALIEERYSDMIDLDPAEEAQSPTVTSIILPYTDVKYKLPDKVEDGQTVEFEITGPDMASIISGMDTDADQLALLDELDAALKAGGYETRSVTVKAQIVELDRGYKLELSFAFLDALYGGMLSILSDAMQTAEQ